MEKSGELLPEVRKEIIKGLLTSGFRDRKMPDVLFSFGASIKPDKRAHPNESGYRTLSYSDLSEHGLVTGSRTRVIATAEIVKIDPEIKVVTTSFNRTDLEEPSMAGVVREELVKRGVSPDQIIVEEDSFNTLTQLKEMVRLAVENKWHRIVAMTNDFHLPRMQEMYNQLGTLIDDEEFQQLLEEFKKQESEVELITAEEIMRLTNQHFETYLNKVVEMPEYKENIRTEAKGLQALQSGQYRTPKKIEEVKPGE